MARPPSVRAGLALAREGAYAPHQSPFHPSILVSVVLDEDAELGAALVSPEALHWVSE
jgi:hypothetical protein